MYSLLLAIIYTAFLSLGLPDSLLGSSWPVVHIEMDVPISYMGVVAVIISGGTIVSSLLSDALTRRIGTRFVTVGSVFLTVVALFGFSFSTKFYMLILFAVPYGLGAGAVDAALNNYVALYYSSKQMLMLHCFWGVGAIVSPFVMSYALSASSWKDGYRIVGFLQLAIAVLLLVTLPVWKKVNDKADEKPQKSVGLIGALKIKGVIFLLIGFFAYCAAEITTMGWASTYFSEAKGVSAQRASLLASLFYIGITVGRFLSGFISDRLGDRKMIRLGTAVLLTGVIMLLIPGVDVLVSEIGFIVIGFGCAPIYPCIIHCAPATFGEENSGAIIGIQMASAYVGSTLAPPVFGFLGNAVGFEILPVYLLVFFVLMIIMTEATFAVTKKSAKNAAKEN